MPPTPRTVSSPSNACLVVFLMAAVASTGADDVSKSTVEPRSTRASARTRSKHTRAASVETRTRMALLPSHSCVTLVLIVAGVNMQALVLHR